MSSIKNLYDLSKRDKKQLDSGSVVVYGADLSECTTVQKTLNEKNLTMLEQLEHVKTAVARLESLKDCQEQHKNMKTNFNAFVDAYNKSTAETQAVICDISDRLNAVESALGI